MLNFEFFFYTKYWQDRFARIRSTGYPLHRENRENGQKKSLSGKTQGIWKFCQNTEKTQGIWFAQVVNSLILKVKDISLFAAKNSKNVQNFFEAG